MSEYFLPLGIEPVAITEEGGQAFLEEGYRRFLERLQEVIEPGGDLEGKVSWDNLGTETVGTPTPTHYIDLELQDGTTFRIVGIHIP